MSLPLQHLLVLAGVGGCVIFLSRGVFRALQGRKSRLSGCGICTGCPSTSMPSNKALERTVMIPMDALTRSSLNKRG